MDAITLVKREAIKVDVTTANQNFDFGANVVYEGFLADNQGTADMFLHFGVDNTYVYNQDECFRLKAGEQKLILIPFPYRYLNCRTGTAGKLILNPVRK